MNYRTNKFHEESLFSVLITKLLNINWIIVFCVILLCMIGVASLYSAAGGQWNPWAKSHFIRSVFGIFLMGKQKSGFMPNVRIKSSSTSLHKDTNSVNGWRNNKNTANFSLAGFDLE